MAASSFLAPLLAAMITVNGGSWHQERLTWYGPGFYGNRTACGLKMTRRLIGVAHRTLPCGTLVEVQYHGHDRVVPVVDRGPYGVSWSLDATARLMIKLVGKPVHSITCDCVKWRVVKRR